MQIFLSVLAFGQCPSTPGSRQSNKKTDRVEGTMESQDDPKSRVTLHYVGSHPTERASFAKLCLSTNCHCELYSDLSELAAHPPRDGIVVLQDPTDLGSLSAAIDRLEDLGVWLPVIATGAPKTPDAVIQVIRCGILDYLSAPVQSKRLKSTVDRVSKEASRTTRLRRRRIEANERLKDLSARESEVLGLLSDGLSNKQTARVLGISPRTVEAHRANILRKLGVRQVAGAIRVKLEASLSS